MNIISTMALAGAAIFSSVFALTVKYSAMKSHHLKAVGAVNYVLAFLVYLVASMGQSFPRPEILLIGIAGGAAYVIAFYLLVYVIHLRGVSISTAVVRLSVLFPIVFSIILWGERPNTIQGIGIGLAVVSLILLGIRRAERENKIDIKGLLLTCALFLSNGGCNMAIRIFHQIETEIERTQFFCILFGVAAVVSIAVLLFDRGGASKRDIIPGIVLGLCNSSIGVLILVAMQSLPSIIVFPFNSSVGLVLTTLIAVGIWKEKISRTGYMGLAVSLIAAVLMNLG